MSGSTNGRTAGHDFSEVFTPLAVERRAAEVEAAEEEREAAAMDALREHDQRVSQKVADLRALEEARGILAAEQRAVDTAVLPEPVLLVDALREPREGPKWRIDGLLHAGGNVILTAVQKAGKTTMVGELIRSLVDGAPFLDQHDVVKLDGRAVLLNYEMEKHSQIEWLADPGIENTSQVAVLHLKGHRVPLLDRAGIEWMAERLRALETEAVVLDPFGAAYLSAGGTEMDSNNTLVGAFLRGLDELKRLSGVRELIMPAHAKRDTAEGAERPRGPAMLGDWPEALWVLTRDDAGRRYFRATEGRDVHVPERQVVMDISTRRLAVAGGNRAATREQAHQRRIIEYVRAHPGQAMSDVVAGCVGEGLTRDPARALLNRMTEEFGPLEIRPGRYNARLVFLAEDVAGGEA